MSLCQLFSIPTPERLSREDEILRLKDLNDHLIAAIPVLLEEQAQVSRRINALQSIMQVLPREVLTRIIYYAYEPASPDSELARSGLNRKQVYFNHFPLTFAAVCSEWRRAIFSDPRLWTKVSVGFNGAPLEGYFNLLRLYFTNSGGLKLDVNIDFCVPHRNDFLDIPVRGVPWPSSDTLIHPSTDDIILCNLNRIRNLHLYAASPSWLKHATALTNLVDFSFTCNRDIPKSLTLPDAHSGVNNNNPMNNVITFGLPDSPPRLIVYSLASFTASHHLRKIAMRGGTFIDLCIGPHWEKITTLNLIRVERSTCIELLALCTNLEVYHCDPMEDYHRGDRINGRVDMRTFWNSPVTRPQLSTFIWDGMRRSDYYEDLVFRNLHLPSIRELRIAPWSSRQDSPMFEFCRRLPPSISSISLELNCESDSENHQCFLESLNHILDVEELEISCMGNNNVANHTFAYMSNGDFLPKVKRFKFIGFALPSPVRGKGPKLPLPAPAGEQIVRIIQERVAERDVKGFLILLENVTVGWTEEDLNQLTAIKAEANGQLVGFSDDQI
ncbi:hypothetical protein AN958_05235 [Leucoagaricus sp. SymC.cos]|nr:hypothetical protein AN958_05235 [Leucoagaricus sp. SymC.cos]